MDAGPGFPALIGGKASRNLQKIHRKGLDNRAQIGLHLHSTAQVGHILSLSLSVAIFYLYKKRVALAGCRYNRHIRPVTARFLLPESLCMRTKWYIVPPANAPPHRAPAGRADALTGLSASH